MHNTLVLALSLFSLFSLLSPITAQGFATTINYAQVNPPLLRPQISHPILTLTPQIQSDIGAYVSSLAAQPAFTSVQSVLATGLPKSIFDDPSANPAGFLATATALPSYFTALPSDVLSYLRSVGLAEISIVTKDLGAGGASTAAAGTSTMATSTVPSTMVTSTMAVGAVGTTSSSVTSAANPTAASTDSSTPSTTTSRASAPSALAVQAAGVLVAVGAVGFALL